MWQVAPGATAGPPWQGVGAPESTTDQAEPSTAAHGVVVTPVV